MSSEVSNILKVTDWSMVLIAICAIIGFGVAAMKAFEYIKDFFGIETKKSILYKQQEEEFQKIHAYIDKLEIERKKESEKSLQDYNKIISSIDELKEIMNNHIKEDQRREEENKEARVATIRSTLWRLYKESTDQGYIDKDCLTTFMECGKIYEKSGGNGIYKEKLYPEVLNLPVKD